MSNVTKPQKGPCHRVDFWGLGPYENPTFHQIQDEKDKQLVIFVFKDFSQCNVIRSDFFFNLQFELDAENKDNAIFHMLYSELNAENSPLSLNIYGVFLPTKGKHR